MAVNLSPVGGVAAQFFTNTGAVLTGGKLYTYAAGTTTPVVTYTSSSGLTAWTSPIVLDAAGRVPNSGEIWLTDGINYKFVLKDANDVLIATYDNISGINSNFVAYSNQQDIQTATAGQTVFTLPFSYQPATNSLSVFVDGVNQYGPGAQYSYVETDSTTVTFNAGLHVGAEVKFTTTQQQGAGAVDASQVTYDPPFTGGVATNVEDKLAQYVSVKDFGAVGDGVTDDTAAFNAAITTGKAVFVPYTVNGYLVSNINVVSNMYIVGEKSGVTQTGTNGAPLLIVSTSGTSAFYNSVGDNVFDVWFENLACTAAAGVTDASFYKSSTQTFYSAYFTFKNIETYKNLRYGYLGLFIFALWDRCRDGYMGSAIDTEHSCVVANATYGQTNAQNINMFRDCMLFGSFGGTGAIVAQYGSRWSFENTDFEGLQVPAVVAQNIFGVVFEKCWFENITATALIEVQVHPTQANAGSSIYVYNCSAILTGAATYFASFDSYCSGSFRDNDFALVPSGMTLSNDGTKVLINENNNVSSGAGAAAFMTAMHPDVYTGSVRLLNGATDNGLAVCNIQNKGATSATDGFLSTAGTSVTTSFVTVATANTGVGGLCFVSGYNTSGGTQGWWLVAFRVNGAVATIIASNDATTTTPSFQVSGAALQMKTTSGTVSVNTTFLN